MIKYLFLLLPIAVFASDPHHDHPAPIIYPVPIIQEQYTITDTTEGVSLGIATAQHHFDLGTHKWQWSAGYGYFDGNDAVSFSIGKRVDRVLINGSIGREGGKTGYGVGLNGRF